MPQWAQCIALHSPFCDIRREARMLQKEDEMNRTVRFFSLRVFNFAGPIPYPLQAPVMTDAACVIPLRRPLFQGRSS
jgi:hypothetical protein